ncbi:NAD(P)H-dependent oxidoreductase [Cytophagaceae bacterium DM2B3-1]|uniref:FMN dependent NADH:quinone oxidoreductase n=1 Tax=Xanthocytophaga flava TaxID=3048013 RepID=A0ABT7CSX6_9BACT|nr:NAD(P)H-dependent oxidoreductase [Xanthocytophaga flavus]MDJ1496810.1 NAD(P)H-dependent oxidoreductase [Xanthocytophaga flavus]
MAKVLHIISSTRGAESLTLTLGNAIIDRIKTKDPDTVVKEIDLSANPYPHLGPIQISSFFTPEESRTPEQELAVRRSDEAVAELQDADILVIGAPMYNYSITSSLKAYFDHIARARLTFRYSESGVEGLLKNKKAYIAFGSAGVFGNEQMQAYDFAVPYMKHFLGFLGITDVTVFRVEGTGIPGLQETALEKALESIAV